MEIPVLVEPTAGGFRAAAGSPLDLAADGPTADAALAALRARVADRLKGGAQLRTLAAPDPGSTLMTPARFAAAMEAARRLRENPMFEEYMQAVEEYRREANAVPDPDAE